jgi:hypothetical protein
MPMTLPANILSLSDSEISGWYPRVSVDVLSSLAGTPRGS